MERKGHEQSSFLIVGGCALFQGARPSLFLF
jgi:hypothetical protein